MLKTIADNSKLKIYFLLTIISEVLRNNPSLVDFLPENARNYVLGISSIVFATLSAMNVRQSYSFAQLEAREVKEELKTIQLKEEIKADAKLLVEEAKAIVDQKVEASIPIVVQRVIETVPAIAPQPAIIQPIVPPNSTENPIKVELVETKSEEKNE